jgi:iron complex transport system substrate-binding protein
VKNYSALAFAALFATALGTRAGPPFRPVIDGGGRVVSVPAQPQRILSLCTTVTDTLLRLGQKERLAGIDEYSRVVPGATNLAVLGRGSALSREQVLARQIDLAFVWWFQDDAARFLADLQVPVVRIRCNRSREIPATIRLIGQCLDLASAADTLAQSVAERLARLSITNNSTTPPSVYLELYSPFKTSGRDSCLNDLIELAGGRNIAADVSGPILLSAERLIQADPEVILLVEGFATPDSFARRNGMSALAAVKAGRVHTIDRYWLVAGAGLPDAVANLEDIVAGTLHTKR